MAEAPEIPEVSNPFEKRVALTIALLAVVLALVENLGDNAKTEAIIKTNEAANQWAYYQSKSIKENVLETEARLMAYVPSTNPDGLKQAQVKVEGDIERYQHEKGEIKGEAEKLVKEASAKSLINDRCDLASLLLQISVVVCSVAILSVWPPLWIAGIVMGVAGSIVGVTAFLM